MNKPNMNKVKVYQRIPMNPQGVYYPIRKSFCSAFEIRVINNRKQKLQSFAPRKNW